jgi:hypothetical protein
MVIAKPSRHPDVIKHPAWWNLAMVLRLFGPCALQPPLSSTNWLSLGVLRSSLDVLIPLWWKITTLAASFSWVHSSCPHDAIIFNDVYMATPHTWRQDFKVRSRKHSQDWFCVFFGIFKREARCVRSYLAISTSLWNTSESEPVRPST